MNHGFSHRRLIDHVHLRARNFLATRLFYEAVLAVLGIPVTVRGEGWMQVDELFIDTADARTIPTHIHLAFQARDRAMVDAFHAPPSRPAAPTTAPRRAPLSSGLLCCFVLDPDGNNVEAVFHGPSTRSADAVTITPVQG